MAQRSQMFYAYFRFYVNESELIAGMNKFCTGWENMFAIGYNYREFKCFVDDLGGFEHWVGDMRGYISPTREIGFIDGAPGEGVFDQTLLMGAIRIITSDVDLLNGFIDKTKLVFRNITGKDAGTTHKVEFKCGASQKIKHPVMYTIESTKIEIVAQTSEGITDNSDVDEYEIMVDVDAMPQTGTLISCDGTMTNFDNAFDKDLDTYYEQKRSSDITTIISFPLDFTCVAIKGYNSIQCDTLIYYSPDGIAWTQMGATQTPDGFWYHSGRGVDGKYLKIYSNITGPDKYTRIYEIIVT